MATIDEMINGPNPTVAYIAQKTQDLMAQKASGALSASEYTELAGDLLKLGQVDQIATTVTDRAELLQALQDLQEIAGIVGMV